MAVHLSRGEGIYVERQPFGSPYPGFSGRNGPFTRLSAAGEGAHVEFDEPPNIVPTPESGGTGAKIPCTGPFTLRGLNPEFVIVKRWWLCWMTWKKL
jgi:hypothetical protein